ncbi:MAG: hypothetical protein JKY31_07830 [Rhodobacteraceae bacterium]|nr:hypothetical protein [Paracoccaceae bacterium]
MKIARLLIVSVSLAYAPLVVAGSLDTPEVTVTPPVAQTSTAHDWSGLCRWYLRH